ncbi:MAG: hypothetical protein QM710_01890 [Flavobacterium sp.]
MNKRNFVKILKILLISTVLIPAILYFIPDFNPESNSKIYSNNKQLTALVNAKIMETIKAPDSAYILTQKYTALECGTPDHAPGISDRIEKNIDNLRRYIKHNPYSVNKYLIGSKLEEIQNPKLIYGKMTNFDFYKSFNEIDFHNTTLFKKIKPGSYRKIYELQFIALKEDKIAIILSKFDSQKELLKATFVCKNRNWKLKD